MLGGCDSVAYFERHMIDKSATKPRLVDDFSELNGFLHQPELDIALQTISSSTGIASVFMHRPERRICECTVHVRTAA
jgi:hypothetical protein